MHLQQLQHYAGILTFPNLLAAAKLMGWLQCVAEGTDLDVEWFSDDLDVSGWSITSLCPRPGRGRAGPALCWWLQIGSPAQVRNVQIPKVHHSQSSIWHFGVGRKTEEVLSLFWAFFLPNVQGLSIDMLGGQLRAPQNEDEENDEVWGGRRRYHRKASRKVHKWLFQYLIHHSLHASQQDWMLKLSCMQNGANKWVVNENQEDVSLMEKPLRRVWETDKQVWEVKRVGERNGGSAGLESWEKQADTKPWKQWQETEVCPTRTAKPRR